jgi:hypothetical protein
MPTTNKKSNPAVNVAMDIYRKAQEMARKMQQPKEGDSRLKAQIMGGIGGIAEQFIPASEEDMMMNAIMGQVNPTAAMVKMPAHLVEQFAKNFRNRVPQQLEDEGQQTLAYYFDRMAQDKPEWMGQLEDVVITPKINAAGLYTSTASMNPFKMFRSHEAAANAGMTARANNRITINPRRVMENTSIDEFSGIPANQLVRHESKHLDQDLRGLIMNNRDVPYYLEPNEVEARIFEREKEFDLENILNQLHYGKRLEQYSKKTPLDQIREGLIRSLTELERRRQGLTSEQMPSISPDIMRRLLAGLEP